MIFKNQTYKDIRSWNIGHYRFIHQVLKDIFCTPLAHILPLPLLEAMPKQAVDTDAKKIVGAVKITRRHFDQATGCVRCDRFNSYRGIILYRELA